MCVYVCLHVCVCMCMCLCVCVCVHVVCVCEMSCHIAVPTYKITYSPTYCTIIHEHVCMAGKKVITAPLLWLGDLLCGVCMCECVSV